MTVGGASRLEAANRVGEPVSAKGRPERESAAKRVARRVVR
jgi:hypothetical protein